MRYHAILLDDTVAARDRCFDLGVSRALKLDREAFIAAVENLAQKGGLGADHLSDYASVVVGIERSCLSPLGAATRTEAVLVERMLDDAVVALASVVGGAGVLGLLFSVETLNIDCDADADQGERRESDRHREYLLEALGECFEKFARDDVTRDLISASAHHCFDLVSALCGHGHRFGGELTVNRTFGGLTQLESRRRN